MWHGNRNQNNEELQAELQEAKTEHRRAAMQAKSLESRLAEERTNAARVSGRPPACSPPAPLLTHTAPPLLAQNKANLESKLAAADADNTAKMDELVQAMHSTQAQLQQAREQIAAQQQQQDALMSKHREEMKVRLRRVAMAMGGPWRPHTQRFAHASL